VRVEQTGVTYTVPDENIYYDSSDDYDYLEIFPNLKLTYALGGAYRVIAAYNRRIDRPGEDELRIFPKYDDPELLKVGNPYLRPQLTQVVELGVGRSWTDGSVTVSGYHRDITDAFQRIYAIDTSNPNYDIVNRLYENVGRATQTGLEVVADQQLAGPWRISASAHWYVHDIDSLQTTLFFPTTRPFSLASSRDDTWDFTVNNRFGFSGGQEIQLSFINYAARNVNQGRERARSSLDLSASWPLGNERGDVTFTFSDMLNDFGIRRDIQGTGFNALYENLMETQEARIRMRVRF
jgi:outer membrane receptor protein involved in Fe transport